MANPIYLMALELLDAAKTGLELEGLVPPDRRFVAPGNPTHDFAGADCAEQLIVQLVSLDPGLPPAQAAQSHAPAPQARTHYGDFRVWVLRCAPVANTTAGGYVPPTAAELNAAAAQVHHDIWAVRSYVLEAIHSGALWERCLSISVGSAVPYGPLGGVMGHSLAIQAQVMP